MLESPDSTHDIIYALYTLDTPLLRDREFIYLENRYTNLEDGKLVILCFSIDRDDIKVGDYHIRGN